MARMNRRGLIFSLAVCLMAILVPVMPAQTSAAPAPAAPAAPPPAAPAPSGHAYGGGVAVDSSYVLQKNDDIKIEVYGEDDLTTEARISKTGNIAVPLIGTLKLDGMTIDQATSEVRRLLDKDYLVNPQVRITLMEYAKQRFTVLGQVKNPGEFELPVEGTLDLLGAVAMAGGFTRIADPGRVTVRRNVDGKDVVLRVNAKELVKNDNVKPFIVKPGDTISIPESIF